MRFHLLMSLLFLSLSSPSPAADFTCVDNSAFGKVVKNQAFDQGAVKPSPYFETLSYRFRWEGEGKGVKSDDYCLRIAIEGKITFGDADKLEWLLAPDYGRKSPFVFALWSPGGNVLEAMTMGRLLRVAHARVEAKRTGKLLCGAIGQPVCCASACALAYFGGAIWNPGDRLGLHRPTFEDLGERDYELARQMSEEIGALIRQYFKEMEVDEKFFDALTRASPDELSVSVVGRTYPPSLHDWLMSKCAESPQVDRESCMFSKFLVEFHSFVTYNEAKRFSWYSYKSTDELHKMFIEVGAIRREAIAQEFENRNRDKRKQ